MDPRCWRGHPQSTITTEKVKKIIDMRSQGMLQRVIAAELGISQGTVSVITNRKSRVTARGETTL